MRLTSYFIPNREIAQVGQQTMDALQDLMYKVATIPGLSVRVSELAITGAQVVYIEKVAS